MKDLVQPLLNELYDIEIHQRDIVEDLKSIVNDSDKNPQVLDAVEKCLAEMDKMDDAYKNLFKAFGKAAYTKAVHDLNL